MKFLRIFPDTCASTWCLFSSSTRNSAFGSDSSTTPVTSIVSSFATGSLKPSGEPSTPDAASTSLERLVVRARSARAARRRSPPPCARSAPTGCRRCVTAVQPSPSTFTAGLARVHHRLDRQHHALGQPRPAPRRPVVGHLRLLVQRRPDPVADELAHHREAVRLDVPLHRVRRCPTPARRPAPARSPGRATPRSPAAARAASLGHPAHRHRDRRVAEEPVEHRAHVDRDDVALAQRPRPTGCRGSPPRSPTRRASPGTRGSP